MKHFIDFNTRRQKEAIDDFWKLCTNSCYGKQLQNVRNYHVELFTSEESLRRYSSKTNFRNFNKFSENLLGVNMEKISVPLYQPVGFSILEHYDVMFKEYGDKLTLLMTDSVFLSAYSSFR